MASTVVVLGGGVGGLVAARELRARLSPGHRVVLVERQPRHVFSPSLLWLMVGARRPEHITRDTGWLSRRGVEVIPGEVRAIDPQRRVVETSRGTVQADALVVSLGLDRTLDPVPGAAQHAHEFYSLEGADRLRQALQRFRGGTVAIAVLATPYSCPAAPYEAALLLDAFLRRRGCSFRVAVYTPEPYPMPTAGPAVGQALQAILERRGIHFRPQVKVSEVREGTLVLSDGSEAPYDLLVAIPVHRAPEPVRNSPLAGPTGLVPVDGASLQTRFPGVWALGDVVSLALPGRFQPDVPLALPKAGFSRTGRLPWWPTTWRRAWRATGRPPASTAWASASWKSETDGPASGSGGFSPSRLPGCGYWHPRGGGTGARNSSNGPGWRGWKAGRGARPCCM